MSASVIQPGNSVASVLRAARFAGRRTFEVWWTGVLLLVFWMVFITVGPAIESRTFPVVANFHIAQTDLSKAETVMFRPAFDKTRSCHYLGMQWFVKSADGRLSRHQVIVNDNRNVSTSYPVGPVLAGWWEVSVKDKDREMYGVLHHNCGLPWESRSLVGSFVIAKTKTGASYIQPAILATR